MHVWVDGKLTPEQEFLAREANSIRANIQNRLQQTYAIRSAPTNASATNIDASIKHFSVILATCEAQLWAASKFAVRTIHDSSSTLQTSCGTTDDSTDSMSHLT